MSSLLRLSLVGQMVLALCCIAVCDASAIAQDRLHAFIVADTLSEDIKADMEVNVADLAAVLHENIPEHKLVYRALVGRDFSRNTIRRAIENADVAPNDSILFYYCGHGYYQSQNGSYFLPPTDNRARLEFKSIKGWLKNKNCRSVISILDSCSVIPGGAIIAPAPSLGPGPPRPPRHAQVSALFQSLFFNSQGHFHINSSAPGEYAICRTPFGEGGVAEGSLFTSVLCGELNDSDRNATWDDVYRSCRRDVSDSFRRFYRDGVIRLGRGRSVQQNSQTVWALQDDIVIK